MAGEASPALRSAEVAIQSIGLGFDIAVDLRLKYCKKNSVDSRLIAIGDDQVRDIAIPGKISIPKVSKSIKCEKGERMRFHSDVLSFHQMSGQFNQEISLSGNIPSGQFNAAFEFTGSWQKDAANTKTLAFDAVYITLYSIALEKSQIVLRDHVKEAVPSSWDPAALARFIEKYGTHVIVGVKMGGKDIVYVKQQHSSPLQPADVQKRIKDMADKWFIDAAGRGINPEKVFEMEKFDIREHGLTNMGVPSSSYSNKEDITFFCKRRGGIINKNLTHNEWCHTVQFEPDVISMSFIPITSLLSGINGSGFLMHAINLYLRYKPPIEELHQFLEFQLPRQWAPVFGELALGPQRKQQSSASLQFCLMGPKLYVNTTLVDVGNGPVTGLRLYLEGKGNNRLAIQLQHLSSQPKNFHLVDNPNTKFSCISNNYKYYEKLSWKSLSHVCTAPVESDEDLSIVTGAQLEVGNYGLKKVLFLSLQFSRVIGATVVKQPEWGDDSLSLDEAITVGNPVQTSQKPPPRAGDVTIGSAAYPDAAPSPVRTPKLLRFVDMTEMARGPQDTPGYWVVSGARLLVKNGRISLLVKYSLLNVALPAADEAP